MSAARPSAGAALVKQRVAGVAFLGVLAGLVGLTVATYNKVFTPVVEVTLQADRAGNQLTPPADVKVNGLVVGEAREVQAGPDGAIITLALEPEQAARLPENVSARLLPKTLFGEKYVELVLPEDPVEASLTEGDVIPQDRSETARELATALDNSLPLLQTLEPQAVSTTLNALSAALRGRGERLGENLVLVRDYLEQFNPELPTLAEDFRGIADFADTLDAASPDLLALLDDLSFLNRSLVDQRAQLDAFLSSTAGVTRTFDDFLAENEQRFVTLPDVSREPLALFARYAPEYPCLASGLALADDYIGDSFGNLQPGLHITLEFTEAQGAYRPTLDEPRYLDDRGPRCYGLDRLDEGGFPERPAPDINFEDGYRDDQGPDDSQPPAESGGPSFPAASPVAATAAERTALSSVIAPVLGVRASEVPDLAHLLFGPVARGTAVGLSSEPPQEEAA